MGRGLVGYSPWGLQRIWHLVTNTFLHMYTACVMYFALLIPQFSSVAQSCLTICVPMGCSMPGLLVHHQLLEFTQIHVHWVGDAIQPSHPLPNHSPLAFNLSQLRVFSNESVLRIRWPVYWSFSFSISPSNEYSGLISFRMDWLDLLAFQGTLKSLLQHHTSKASILRCSAFFLVQLSHPYMSTGETIALSMLLMKTGVDKDKRTSTHRTDCCLQPNLSPKATCELFREVSHGPCSLLASSSITLPPSIFQAWLWNRSSSERSLCSYISSVTLPQLLMRTAWAWLLGFLFGGTSIPLSTLPFETFCWGTLCFFSKAYFPKSKDAFLTLPHILITLLSQ